MFLSLENRYLAAYYLVIWRSRRTAALDGVETVLRTKKGRFAPDLTNQLFDRTLAVPFSAGPVVLSGVMRPKAEIFFAETAGRKGSFFFLCAADSGYFALVAIADVPVGGRCQRESG